jgi:isochorismate synthase
MRCKSDNVSSGAEIAGAAALWRLPGEKDICFIEGKNPLQWSLTEKAPQGFLFAPFDARYSPAWLFSGEQKKAGPEDAAAMHVAFSESRNKGASTPKQHYIRLVVNAIHEMKSGSYKKIIGARKQLMPFKGTSPLPFFINLCAAYPDAFCYLVSSPQTGTWAGASPELLMDFSAEKVKTDALAGTKTSGSGDWGSKELEEQELVVDYISRILKEEGLEIKISPKTDKGSGGLLHLYNEISGYGHDLLEKVPRILQQLYPTPAVAGIPKLKAMDFIRENEDFDRSYYAGFLGYSDKEGGALYVNLRCMNWDGKTAALYAGAGLTEKSDPEKEWEETGKKLEVLGSLMR